MDYPLMLYMYIQGRFTPLLLASRNGKEDTVELLISAGANLHLTNEVNE